MLLVIVGFFAVASSKILESKEESNRQISQDIAEFAYQEIEMAKSVNDGYTRTFIMPQTVNGVDYSISIIDNRELVVNYLEHEYVKFLPANVIGNITRGVNQIFKNNGVIFVNSTPIQISQSLLMLLMKNNLFNVISFDSDGNVVLRGALQQNPNPVPSTDDEFIFRDSSGNTAAILNLITGDMAIKGTLSQNQPALSPSPSSSDFIVKDLNGNVISYIDESGNFLLKGILTQNGNP